MLRRRPTDDPRRRYATFLQIGLAGALGLAVAAFTVPYAPGGPEPFVTAAPDEPVRLVPIPPTDMAPPPPPPPAPPPPVAVPDDVEVEAVVAALDLRLDEALPPPAAPAPIAQPVQTPPLPVLPPPAPTINPAPPPAPSVEPEDPDRVFVRAQQQPELIGGLEELQRRVQYPRLARDANISGRVFIQFVVDERGNVVDPVVTRTPSDLLSEAALKAVRESKFIPGSQRGRPVKVRYSLPVNFVLN